MRKALTLSLCLGALLTGAAGCDQSSRSKAPAPAAGGAGPAAAADPKKPVAKVGGEVITEAELAAATKGQITRLEAQHAEQVHGVKAQALDGLVEKKLIDAKAKAEGITAEALIEREVNAKVPEPAEAQVQQVYDQTKASGRPLPPFDQVKGDIVKFLKERGSQETRQKFVEGLKSASKVETMLPPLLPPKVEVSAEGPSKGDPKAPVTIVEFSDFECPFCSRVEPAIKQVLETYKGKVRLVYRDYPLPFHAKAPKASEAALCAGDQGKYWEMHEKLFANQQALEVPQLKEHAKGLGLDQGKFDKCLDGGDKAKEIEASKKAAEAAGVSGTPAFFINGRPLSGALPFERFKEIIDHELQSGT